MPILDIKVIESRIIIFTISFFMLAYISYKISYFILMLKENSKSKFSFKTYHILNENNENLKTNIENITTIKNKTIFISDNLLIPISYSNHLEDLILNYFFHNINSGF